MMCRNETGLLGVHTRWLKTAARRRWRRKWQRVQQHRWRVLEKGCSRRRLGWGRPSLELCWFAAAKKMSISGGKEIVGEELSLEMRHLMRLRSKTKLIEFCANVWRRCVQRSGQMMKPSIGALFYSVSGIGGNATFSRQLLQVRHKSSKEWKIRQPAGEKMDKEDRYFQERPTFIAN